MNGILEFAKNNYVLLIILGVFFLIALIGYLYDRYQHRDLKIETMDENGGALTESAMEEKPVTEENKPVETPVDSENNNVN